MGRPSDTCGAQSSCSLRNAIDDTRAWSVPKPFCGKACSLQCDCKAYRIPRSPCCPFWTASSPLIHQLTSPSENLRFKHNVYLRNTCESRGCRSHAILADPSKIYMHALCLRSELQRSSAEAQHRTKGLAGTRADMAAASSPGS